MLNRSLRAAVSALLLVVPLGLGLPQTGLAQTGPAATPKASSKPKASTKPKYNPYGSPLDTIMSTRLWTNVPPAEDFVKATRPDPKSLDYTPLTGKDPDRPKLRDGANIQALQAELEQSGVQNERKAKGLGGVTKPRPRKPSTDAAR